MARDGLKWLASDMHLAEPGNLWQGYIEPELRDKVADLTGVTPDYDVLGRSTIHGNRHKPGERSCGWYGGGMPTALAVYC